MKRTIEILTRRSIILLLVSALLAAFAVGCANSAPDENDVPDMPIEQFTPAPAPTIPVEEVVEDAPNEDAQPDSAIDVEDGDILVDESAIPDEETYIPDELTELYLPGTYQGESEGHDGTLVAEVTVDTYSILSIEVVEHSETQPGVALMAIPSAIMELQSTDIDAVSGATVTSDAIVDAVMNALELASIR